MDTKDVLGLAISVASACISIVSVIIARISISKQRAMQAWVTNHDLLNRATGMLIADHSLLGILGIDSHELVRDGITPAELIYINTSLDASSVMHRITGDNPVVLTEYRQHFLRNAKVRTAWKKYLRNRTFNPSPFTKAVDTYIAEVESRDCVATNELETSNEP